MNPDVVNIKSGNRTIIVDGGVASTVLWTDSIDSGGAF